MQFRAALLVFLALLNLAHAQRFNQDLIGRWKVEFQDPPEREIVTAQLRSLNLEYLAGRMDLPALDPLIITISRNKFMIQADSQLLEVYNCVLEPESIVILDRQEMLSPIPLEYQYRLLDDNDLLLSGTLNKINNLPVTLRLRRVLSIPTFGDGQRGFLTRQGFLDVGTLTAFRGSQVVIQPKNKKPVVHEVGHLDPLDQISLHEPELVAPDRIQANFEEEKKRFKGLPYPILTSSEPSENPVFFTKEYYFDEDSMSEGYLITIYNTAQGELTIRATGSGGGASRGDLDIRYLKDRNNADKMIVWLEDDEIFERPLDEVKAEQAAKKSAAVSAPAITPAATPESPQSATQPVEKVVPRPIENAKPDAMDNTAPESMDNGDQQSMDNTAPDAPANIEMISEPME